MPMRNVHLQLSFVFSFGLLFFFPPNSILLVFLSPCTTSNLLIILVILYTAHNSIPFLSEVGGAKMHAVQTRVTLGIYMLE